MLVLLGVALVIFLVTVPFSCSTPESGTIGVVRNGGPLDNKGIRGVLCPGVGNTWTGIGSGVHAYPDSTSQRTYKFSDEGKADAPAIKNLRTSDGVKVTLSGTFYFKTGFDCSAAGQKLVRAFDQAFVNRPEGQRPWENWQGWLDSTWKPILDANARDVILAIECKNVVSSCALLARDGNVNETDIQNADNKSNIAKIEKAMADGLITQLEAKLGGPDHLEFFREVTFNMEQPTLPEVDDSIATAQQAFAKVADVRAERIKQEEQVKVEFQKRRANDEKQKGYDKCSSCARQDELKAFGDSIPDHVTTLVMGGNSPVAIGGK